MKRLKEIREQRGMSQHGLADASGVSRATIARIEAQGDYFPKEETIDKLADALDVLNVELFADDEFDFPFGPDELMDMGGERLSQLLFSLAEGSRLGLGDAAERLKWTALRRGGNARRLPGGEKKEAETKQAMQAVYFWGYLDGHNDQRQWGAALEEADRKDREEVRDASQE